MLVAAWGMWTQRYWAVLGFQSLLAITIVVFALFLMAASNVWAALLCVAVHRVRRLALLVARPRARPHEGAAPRRVRLRVGRGPNPRGS